MGNDSLYDCLKNAVEQGRCTNYHCGTCGATDFRRSIVDWWYKKRNMQPDNRITHGHQQINRRDAPGIAQVLVMIVPAAEERESLFWAMVCVIEELWRSASKDVAWHKELRGILTGSWAGEVLERMEAEGQVTEYEPTVEEAERALQWAVRERERASEARERARRALAEERERARQAYEEKRLLDIRAALEEARASEERERARQEREPARRAYEEARERARRAALEEARASEERLRDMRAAVEKREQASEERLRASEERERSCRAALEEARARQERGHRPQ